MDFSGMTLNERLFEAKLLDQFQAAANAKDRKTLIDILGKVNVKPKEAEWTIDTIFNNSEKYGFKRQE
ncbi:MAG: hypothetical protein HQL19_00960 [Candidatus Omnitrophica bacterium]|nr:hypothetical protein [Candidatus Omnitrophota bacterium]